MLDVNIPLPRLPVAHKNKTGFKMTQFVILLSFVLMAKY